MTTEFIAKRSKSLSDQLEKIKEKMSSLEYELLRQAPFDLKDHVDKIDEFASAYVDIKEAIDKLDSIAQYFNEIK